MSTHRKTNKPRRHGRRNAEANDPIGRLIEWEEHRYDPGHYTGGNIHPLFAASRPNKYGYALIAGSIMVLVLKVLSFRAGERNWYGLLIPTVFALFFLWCGLKLVTKPRKTDAQTRRKRKT